MNALRNTIEKLMDEDYKEKCMKELIDISKGFQTSVNIAYDLNNDEKVRSFIPTMSSLDVIEDVLLSTVASSTQRARILIGAYGRGKSHIVLVLMSLLFKQDEPLFDTLLNKMEVNNPSLYEFAVEYIKRKQSNGKSPEKNLADE